jgi:hypothetical protein
MALLMANERRHGRMSGPFEESIDQGSKVKQVIQGADELEALWRAGGNGKIRPVSGDE